MFRILLFIFFIALNAWGQQQTTMDQLPNTNSSDSTAILNNNLRMQQNAINSIGGYFNSNGYLTEANGGTGSNLSATPNGSLFAQDATNVGIGTLTQGTSGTFLESQGVAAKPIWAAPYNPLFNTNVGIGSTNPGQLLDVNGGNIRIVNGGLITTQTTIPTAGSCGGGVTATVTAKSTDSSGSLVLSGAATTGCTISLKQTHTIAPNCICMDNTSSSLMSSCISDTSTLIYTTSGNSNGHTITWHCFDNQ